MHKSQRLYALSCRGYMLSCRGYMHELQRLYAGYSDNKANSAQFQLRLGLSLAKKHWTLFPSISLKCFVFLGQKKGSIKYYPFVLVNIIPLYHALVGLRPR